MSKVLIATDGSDIARESAARAGTLLGPVESVTVLAVFTDIPGDDAGGFESSVDSPEDAKRILEGEQSDADAAIDGVIEVLPESWRPLVTRRIEGGDAGPMIVWVAEQERSDVIVVGSHGHGVLKRLLTGSVSTHVIHHAPCPVLLVRHTT